MTSPHPKRNFERAPLSHRVAQNRLDRKSGSSPYSHVYFLAVLPKNALLSGGVGMVLTSFCP
jgi:hypothetical protein